MSRDLPLYKCPITKNMINFSKNYNESLKFCSDMLFNMRKLIAETIFTKLEYLTHFWAPQGSKRAQNGVNVPISSQIGIETCKFGLICYST